MDVPAGQPESARQPAAPQASAWVPYFVLGLSLLATLGATAFVHRNAREQDELRFKAATERTRISLTRHVDNYSFTVRNVAALFQTGGIPSRKQVNQYLSKLDVPKRYPGIESIGFSVRLPAKDREAFEKVARENDVDPAFRIWPVEPLRDDYHTIMYIEPLDERNRPSLGYDMHSDPARAAAMDAAADTAELAASGKLALLTGAATGFVLYMPLYRGPELPPPEELRREKLIGHIFAPIRADDFFRGMFAGDPHADVDVRLYDGTEIDPARLLHDSAASGVSASSSSSSASAASPRFTSTETLPVAGRIWTLRSATRPEFDAASGRWLPPVIFIAGAVVSFTFFMLTRAQVRALARGRRTMHHLERSQRDLLVSESRFRRLAEANLVGVAFCDLDGNVSEGNDEYFRIIGRRRDEVIASGLRRDQITPPEFHDRDRRAIEELKTTGVAAPYEKQLVRPDGTRVDVLVGMAMLEGSGSECVVLDVDITERKRFERELREAKDSAEAANTAKDRFLAVLSHELRTPLAPVLLAISIWEREASLAAELRGDLQMIRRNIELEARLIDDLLDLTRIGRGKLHLDLEVVDAHAVVRRALEVGPGREAEAKNLTLTTRLEAADASLRGDDARLQQVFWNLLHNAVKFTPAGGSVTVRSLNPAPGRLRIEVSDTGIGIDPLLLPRIFDAFEQGEDARSRASGGLGLGLAITRGLVHAHGGIVDVSSKGVGCGATFVVELPTTAAPAAIAAPDVQQPAPPACPAEAVAPSDNGQAQPPAAPKLRILIVEDHEDSARVLERLLRGNGYATELAQSVAEASRAGLSGAFDLLLTDLSLPDGSGIDVLRALRRTRDNATIPAIALTGHGMPEDLMHTQAAGFCLHLTKPVDLQQLEAAIRRSVEEERAVRLGTSSASPSPR